MVEKFQKIMGDTESQLQKSSMTSLSQRNKSKSTGKTCGKYRWGGGRENQLPLGEDRKKTNIPILNRQAQEILVVKIK